MQTETQAAMQHNKHQHAVNLHVAMCSLPLSLFVLLALGLIGGGYWLILPILTLMVIVPLLDLLTGWQDNKCYERSDFSGSALGLLHWNTRLFGLLYIATVCWLTYSLEHFTAIEIALLISNASLIGGICFAASHELMHSKSKFDQVLQRIISAFLFYPHYHIIHLRSHHIHAATDHDENTAWFNENIYAYLLRTVPDSMARSWQIEASRIDARYSGTAKILHNRMLVCLLSQVAILSFIYFLGSFTAILFYLAQLLGAHIVLESVNYIQHYGLMRNKQDERYEKTGAEHSWDSYQYFSSYMTFRVGHHSNHHMVVKPYYLLAPEAAAPKLPVGYFWAIPMVLLPPWWRHVSHTELTQQTLKP